MYHAQLVVCDVLENIQVFNEIIVVLFLSIILGMNGMQSVNVTTRNLDGNDNPDIERYTDHFIPRLIGSCIVEA